MANIKNFKLLRNETALTSRVAAVSALEGLSLTAAEEGTLVLARYTEDSTPGSVLGIVNLDGSVTVLDLSGEIQEAIQSLDSTLTLSGTAAQDAHFTQVAIVDGMLNPTTSSGSNIDIAHLVDLVPSNDANAILATTDTIHGALTKIEAAILGMDKAANAEAGKVVTTVSEADGVVSETKANVIDLTLTGYSKEAASTGAIAATDDVQTALSKLENGIAEGARVDGKTIVKGADGLETDVDIVYVPAVPASGDDPAVPAKIELQDNTGATLSSIDVSNIIGNGFLKSSSYAPATGILTLVFNEGGTDVSYNIDLGALFDYEDIIIKSDSTDYLSWSAATPSGDTSQAQLGVKLASVTYTAATQSTPASLTVDQTNGKVVNGDAITAVKNYVDAKDTELQDQIDDLDGDAVKSGTVNGVAGTGTVTNNNLDLTVAGNNVPLTGYTALTPTGNAQETVTIAATDTTNQAFAKVEKAINVNEAVVAAALNDLDSTKVDVISVNGVQSKTPATGDVVASVTIDGGDVDLTGYTKPVSTSAIAATDSVNDAIGKLEKGLEGAIAGGLREVNSGNAAIDVSAVSNNEQDISLVVAASNGTAVDGSTLTDPLSIDSTNGLVFAETLDAGYYAVAVNP